MTASTFFALGPNARETYEAGMRAAYGYTEDIYKWATSIAALTESAAIRDAMKRFEDAGVDEMLFGVAHELGPDSVSRPADIIG